MALMPSSDDSRGAHRKADVDAPDSALQSSDADFEQRFCIVHAALLDMRRGNREAQVALRKEMNDFSDGEAFLAAERVQIIMQALPPAANLIEAKSALYVAREVGPFLPDLGARLFEIAAEQGLAASAHSVTRSAYVEIADKAFDSKEWERVTDFATKAISLLPSAEEGERHKVAFCSAHALLACSFSCQARMEEALYCADSVQIIFENNEGYFEKLLRYGLPHEASDMDAAVEALMSAGFIYREEVKPAALDSAFDKALKFLDGPEPLQRGLRVKVLVRYASEQRELSELIDGSGSEELTSESVLSAALKNVDQALEIIANRGADWDDYRLYGDALRVKADILVQFDEFDAALFEAEQALAQYHRSEAFGLSCRVQKNDVVEILELCRSKLENELAQSDDDPSVDNDSDEDDEGGEGFLPPSEWKPD